MRYTWGLVVGGEHRSHSWVDRLLRNPTAPTTQPPTNPAHPNRSGITWMTKDGLKKPNYWGSLTQAATVRLGNYEGEEVRGRGGVWMVAVE